MGELWICREKVAKNPFYLESERMNIYTIEELGYFLYHNIYFLKEVFFSRELILWIEQELLMPRLSAQLIDGVQKGKNVLWYAWMILEESGCYTSEELEELKQVCLAMENKSEFECGKIRADRLLENGKYVSSIREYYRLLSQKEPEGAYPILIGNIWHNMAVAHARLFLFAEAAEYFKTAYEHNKRQESHEAYLAALEFQQGNCPDADELPADIWPEDDKAVKDYLKQQREYYKKKVMEHGTF